MDIKQYIDYFDEISHLKRDEQFTLLERARDEIKVEYKLPIFAILSFFVRLTFVLLFTGGSYLLFGYSSWIIALSLLLALLCSRVIVTEISDSLILKALKKNLRCNPEK